MKNNRLAVSVDDGVAKPKGTVDTESERANAGALARVRGITRARVSGITRVDDHLKVGSEGVEDRYRTPAVTTPS